MHEFEYVLDYLQFGLIICKNDSVNLFCSCLCVLVMILFLRFLQSKKAEIKNLQSQTQKA